MAASANVINNSLGVVVKADDSRSKGPVFDYRHYILNGGHHFAPNMTRLTLNRLQILMVGR